MLTKQTTICIKSFERVNTINRLLAQLRACDFEFKIIVADDSRQPLTIIGADKVIRLPFDSGLSAGRNAMVKEVDTPYFLLMDDDNCIYNKTNFNLMYETIKNTSFNIVGGQMGNYPFYGVTKLRNNVFHQYYHAYRGVIDGHKRLDFCDNFFIAETEVVLKNPWDDNIKIVFEHSDFFLNGKKSGDFIVTKVNSNVGNNYICESKETMEFYKSMRFRNNDFKSYFLEKWGFKTIKKIDTKELLTDCETLRDE